MKTQGVLDCLPLRAWTPSALKDRSAIQCRRIKHPSDLHDRNNHGLARGTPPPNDYWLPALPNQGAASHLDQRPLPNRATVTSKRWSAHGRPTSRHRGSKLPTCRAQLQAKQTQLRICDCLSGASDCPAELGKKPVHCSRSYKREWAPLRCGQG